MPQGHGTLEASRSACFAGNVAANDSPDLVRPVSLLLRLINQTLDLSSLNTQKVMDMGYMFFGCTSLTTLNLSFLDTQKVTGMSRMFDDCDKLTSLSLGEKFAFVGSDYRLPSGTWYASDGTAYTSNGKSCTIPNNKADTYTRR